MRNKLLKTMTLLWLLVVCQPTTAQQWEILDPLPEGSGKYRCHFVDAQNGWVFRTSSPQLLRTRDGGNTWTELYPMTGMRHIFMADTLVGYMIVQEEQFKLFKTTDGGKSWQINSVQFHYADDILLSPIKPIFFIDKNIGFVATLGTYLKTTDGGNSWNEIELPYNGPAKKVHNITFINDSVGWIAGSIGDMGGKIFYTTDQGENWQLISDQFAVVSELDVFNKDTALITGHVFGTVYFYGEAAITKDNFYSYSWFGSSMQWRKGIFINDTTVLFYGDNDQYVFKLWTMHIDGGELSEIIDFPTIPMYFAAFRLPGIVFLHDSPYNIAKRIDTTYVDILSGKIPQKELTVYPNPASGRLNIKVPDVVKRGKITITNLTGQVVFFAGIENNAEQIDISSFSPGVYLITVITNNKPFHGRFIKL